MSHILLFVMFFSFLLYSMVGCFGYLTFSNNPEQLAGGIILLGDYKGSFLIKISLVLFCFSLIMAFPLNVKPTKEGLRELMEGRKRRTQPEEGIGSRDSEIAHCLWTLGIEKN
jgi:Transmembrane amino acid transporter protein